MMSFSQSRKYEKVCWVVVLALGLPVSCSGSRRQHAYFARFQDDQNQFAAAEENQFANQFSQQRLTWADQLVNQAAGLQVETEYGSQAVSQNSQSWDTLHQGGQSQKRTDNLYRQSWDTIHQDNSQSEKSSGSVYTQSWDTLHQAEEEQASQSNQRSSTQRNNRQTAHRYDQADSSYSQTENGYNNNQNRYRNSDQVSTANNQKEYNGQRQNSGHEYKRRRQQNRGQDRSAQRGHDQMADGNNVQRIQRRQRQQGGLKKNWFDNGINVQRREREQLELQQDELKKNVRHKLLVIVLDGFRWDYIRKYEERTGETLEGFRAFLSEGVQAEYLESVFPAESFPAWQTLQTGLYPEHHDIVGNQFYDPEIHSQQGHSGNSFFNIDDQRATEHMKWWQKDEPLWATAKKHNVSFAAYNWGRCDIPYDVGKRLRFDFCENLYQKDRTKTLDITKDFALGKLQLGFDAAIIYDGSLEETAVEYGPSSPQLYEKVLQMDAAISKVSERLNVTNMADIVNTIIISNHGMTYAAPPMHSRQGGNVEEGLGEDEVEVRKIQLVDKLNREHVRWIVGSGAHAAVYPRDKSFRRGVIDQLSRIEGIQVYDKKDIPERLHYKHGKNCPPILVLAQPGTIILLSPNNVQRPTYKKTRQGQYNPQRLIEQTKMGISGYDPEEPDMRGVFMARGPAFKDGGETLPKIQLVDVYELLCKVLDIPPRKNDGSFDRVAAFLKGSAVCWQMTVLCLLSILLVHMLL